MKIKKSIRLLLTQSNELDQEATFLVRDCSRSASYFKSLYPIIPTQAYDTYWLFAYERQEIFFKKFANEKQPWTKDQILCNHKFTNAYRAADRVSQFLIRNVIYAGPQDPDNIFFRTILFKIFNKIETWCSLQEKFGEVCIENYNFESYDLFLSEIMNRGDKIYSAAYIMPSGYSLYKYKRKHSNHLAMLEQMLSDGIPNKIQSASKLRDVFELLLGYHSIGKFLAYQFAIDLNYTSLINFSENEFVVPGPGALNGISKCFESLGGLTEYEIIKFMKDRQEEEFDRLGLNFRSLWGRQLTLIDCQNLFCEVDKYTRIALPHIKSIDNRKKIKQKYKRHPNNICYFFPPKWGLNEKFRQ